jgi:hypothetical protein
MYACIYKYLECAMLPYYIGTYRMGPNVVKIGMWVSFNILL